MNFIVGLGYVGQQILERFNGEITALTRDSDKAKRLIANGIPSKVGDLDDPCTLGGFGLGGEVLWYTTPPPRLGESDDRMRGLLDQFANNPPQKIIYISTSGVYGDCEGNWIDETGKVNPVLDRAKRRWDAEQQLMRFAEKHGVEWVVLRVPGIYGEGRLPLKRIEGGVTLVCANEAPYTNRIHVYDLVSACLAASKAGVSGTFNVSDDEPSTMTDYFNTVADSFSLPRPHCVPRTEASRVLSAGMMSYFKESRRLNNQKMKDALGVTLKYPNLAEGLKAIVG